MPQYVPDVTEADIERVLLRDYAPEVHDTIREMIRGIEMREKARVVRSRSASSRRTRAST